MDRTLSSVNEEDKMPGRTVNGQPSASRKRSRRVEETDDGSGGEVTDVQQARSNFRHSSEAKRVRLETVDPRKRDATPSEQSRAASEDIEMENGGIASPPKTQYEEMRDGDFSYLANEEADDYIATQRFHALVQDKGQLGDNIVAHNGIIESITCVNFMCHERLHCELGPLLNFIVGENGSGKSAILTAITLCLGGKASATNRGGSLKNFVKEGRDRASLIIKLKNQGEGAYREDLYGDSIIVERHFTKTGTSGFKVKSAQGQTISTKKSEVDEIVEFYALQVDNPLAVLSQDNARQFLNSATAAQKYKYLMEGVQLEQLDRDYRLVCETVEQFDAKLPLQIEKVEALKKQYAAHQLMAELVKSNNDLRRRGNHIRSMKLWFEVGKVEQELADHDQRTSEIKQRIEDCEQAIIDKGRELELWDAKLVEAREALEAAREEDNEFLAQVEAVETVYQEKKKTLEQYHTDERNAQGEVSACNKRLKHLRGKIEAEKKKIEALSGDAVVQLREKLDRIQKNKVELQSKEDQAREEIPALQQKCKGSQDRLREVKQEIAQKTDEIKGTRRKIRELEAGQPGKYDGYDHNMETLVRAIEADKGFKEKPIGPLGVHVQLLKPQWSSILESVLGDQLGNFLVTSKADSKRLQGLMDRYKVRAGILICNRNHIDTTGHEPDPQFDSILRVLKIDNDVVRSQLIIAPGIEQFILIPERVKAEEVMFNGAPPRCVKACLSFHDTRRHEGLLFKNLGGRNISTSPIRPDQNRRARMKTDSISQVTAQKEILQYLETQLRDLQNRQKELEHEHRRNVKELEDKEKEELAAKASITQLDAAITQTGTELDSYEGIDTRLEGLEEQREQLEKDKHHHANQYGEMVIKKEAFNKEVEAHHATLRADRARKKQYEKKLNDAENKVKKREESRNICIAEKNVAHETLDQLNDSMGQAVVARVDLERQVQEYTAAAESQTETRVPMPEGETMASIDAEYISIRRQIKEAQKQRGMSDKDVNIMLAKTRDAHDAAEKEVINLTKMIDALKLSLRERMNKWRTFMRWIFAATRSNFAYLLRQRRFRGELKFDQKRKLLSLKIEPDKSEKSGSARSTKTLSGGEKSFSSICLLLAIWDAMGAPIRCLDEFDVFMDNVNRSVSTNMLIDAARRSASRQYIFITPNAIEGRAKLDKDVKIIRLTDPRQRRLADP